MSFIKKHLFFIIIYLITTSIRSQSTFLPTDISNIEVWLKSTDGISNSSSSVSDWVDQIHFANFQQTNSIRQPSIVNSSILNNYPYLQFNGQHQLLSTLNYTFTDASVFIVALQHTADNSYSRFVDHDFQNGFWIGRNGSTDGVGGGFRESLGAPYGNFEPISNNTPFLYSMIRHSDTTYSFLNKIPNSTPYRITNSAITQSNPISIGSELNGSSSGNKDIFEIIIYNKRLNTSERQQVETYLNNKYAPTLQLTDTIITCTLPLTIKAKKDYFKSYLWQDNSVNDSLVVNAFGKYYLTTTDVFGRVSSDTIYILQDINNTHVNLKTDTAACHGSIININAGASYFDYTWSTGSTSNTISISTSGVYKVTMADCLGNVSSDSIRVNIHPIPSFNLGNDTIVCFNETFKLKPNLLSLQNTTFTWHDNSTDSSILVTTPGKYTLTAVDDIGCSFKDSILIGIDNQLNNVSLGNDTSLCAGNQIKIVTGTLAGVTYYWSTGANSAAITITNTGQYSVIVTNTNNCVAKDTINVNIVGLAPTAQFSNSIGCKNKVVSFNDASIPPSGNTITSWFWNYGDGTTLADTSHLQNPFYTYTDTGTYIISLNITANTGCTQNISKTIHVAPVPTASFVTGISCQNDTTQFTNQSLGINGYPITSYYWDFGDPGPNNNSSSISPKHVFGNTGNYTVTLTSTNNAGCASATTNVIYSRAQVKASFTNGPACTNGLTYFQNTSIIPPSNTPVYSWNLFNSTATTANATKLFSTSGVYPVTLYIDGNNGCTSSITKLINVFLPPISSFTAASVCSKDTLHIQNSASAQSGVISSYNWKLNNSSFSSAQNPTLSIVVTGTNTLSQTVVNSFGCRDSSTKSFIVNPLPNVDFTTNPAAYYYLNEPVSFIPNIINANSYNWNIGSVTSTSQTPTYTFDSIGNYQISLYLEDINNCRNSKTKTLNVSKRYLDLAILGVTSSKDNDGFVTVTAQFANYGSVPVNSFDVHYKVSDAGNIKETWNGTISPNTLYTYSFNSKSASVSDNYNNITCVEIEKVNGVIDFTDNNYMCNSLTNDDIFVSNPIPNPTESDITLPVTLNRDINFSVTIYNSIGQIQMPENIVHGVYGLNFVTLPTSTFARGYYIIKCEINGKIFIKKFIKISNQ